MVRVAIFLAIAAVLVAIGVFLVPVRFVEELSWRADVGGTLTTAIALMLGAVALLVTARVESSDYKAQEETKSDIARLMATLAIILNKGALGRTGEIKNADFEAELKTIEAFVNSTTGFAMYNLVARKSRAARGKSEEWRLFFMYAAEILSKRDEPGLIISRAVSMQEMLLKLTERDLRHVGKSVSNLITGIRDFDVALDENVVIKAMREVVRKEQGNEDGKDRNATVIRKLRWLKEQGVDDPNIDMFLAVNESDTDALQAALDRGANPNMGDLAVLRQHEAILANFKE